MSSRWPFLFSFIFMTAGMVVSVFSGCYTDLITVAAVFICLCLAIFLADSRLFLFLVPVFFFCSGMSVLKPWLINDSSPKSLQSKRSDVPITIEGIISSRPSVSPEGSRLTVKAEKIFREGRTETVSGCLLLYVSQGDVTLMRGDRIRFVARIGVPRTLGLPGEFNYSRYLALQEISATARVVSQGEIVLMRGLAEPSWLRQFDQAARTMGDTIRRAVSNEQVSSVLTALLIGEQRRIPQELTAAYTRAGVNHILSISGFHIGIIAAFIMLLLVWLLTRFEYPALQWNVRMIALLATLPVMLAYLFFTGAAPATARSVVMLTIFAIAMMVERENDSINTLLFAAVLLVALNPPTLFDVSFQLSFISLWGILVAAPPVAKYSAVVKSYWLRTLLQFIAASFAASCVTVIPVLYVFKVATLNGILTNLVIVPLLGYGAVLSGFIALPLMLIFPGCATLLLWPAAKLVEISNQFIMWCSGFPVVAFHGITSLDMLLFLFFMVGLTFVKGRFRIPVIILIPLCAVALHWSMSIPDYRLHITMLSVGQAEAILLKLPDGSTMLVDGGGYLQDNDYDFGQRLLAPALGALHVRRIDRMIATHDHPDHIGGLPYLVKKFPVGEFWSGSKVPVDIGGELVKRKIPRRSLAAGDIIHLTGGVRIEVLSPDKSVLSALGSDDGSINEQSLVFRISYGSFSMIFCADAGFVAEKLMLAGRSNLRSTVIKVGHHGSRYSLSEAFIDSVKPSLAMISAGASNRFGLPAADTLELLKTKRVPVYRTDRDGTIELITDGASWSVNTPYKRE